MKKLTHLLLIIGIVFIILGSSILLINYSDDDATKKEQTALSICKTGLEENKTININEEINNLTINFDFLECVSKSAQEENLYSSNDEGLKVLLSTNNINIEQQSDILFYNYNLDDNYPSYYLFKENLANTEKTPYIVVYASKVDDKNNVLVTEYNIVYPIDNDNSLVIKIEDRYNIFSLSNIEDIANSIIIESN